MSSADAYRRAGGVYAVAHRGGAGLAAENTMAAFSLAHGLGFRYLETDLRVSSDGVCVAFHDAGLRRLTGRPGALAAHSWRELCRMRVLGGYRIPRLEELLLAFPDARFLFDVKDPRAVPPMAEAIRSCRAVDRVCVGGAPERSLADLRRRLGPGLATALSWGSLTRLAVAARTGTRPVGRLAAQFAHVPLRVGRLPVFADRLVGMAHERGIAVLVWTVDDPAGMHRLLDAGVDGVITDRPDLLREVLLARGRWAGPGEPATRSGPQGSAR